MATYESQKYATIPIAATQVADGSVTNAEYQFINTVSSHVQTQIDSKLDSAGAFVVQTGMILPFSAAAGSIPTGYLNCDGAAVSRSTYSTLYALIANTYGAGDGSSTFNVPNLAGRFAIGKSGTYALASTGGGTTSSFTPSGSVSVTVNNHTLTTSQIPSHNHSASTSVSGTVTLSNLKNQFVASPGSGVIMRQWSNNASPTSSSTAYTSFSGSGSTSIGNTGGGGGHNHGASGSFSGSSGSVNILGPYISLNFIIKT